MARTEGRAVGGNGIWQMIRGVLRATQAGIALEILPPLRMKR